MFCNSCGAQIAPNQRFCGACGKPVIQPPAAAAVTGAPQTAGKLARHLRILGILWIAFSALHLLGASGSFVAGRMLRVVRGPWMEAPDWGWWTPHVLPHILSLVGFGLLALAILGFVAAWGILERRAWARTLTIVLAVLALLRPILGTALGIYTLWVLLPADSEAEWHAIAT